MPSEICPKCQKAVYAAERKIAGGKAWHSMCLKCGKLFFLFLITFK